MQNPSPRPPAAPRGPGRPLRALALPAAVALLAAACGEDRDTAPAPDAGAPLDAAASDAATDAATDALADATSDASADALPTENRPDGSPCSADAQCAGGACLGPFDGFPGGFCTVRNCDSARDCTAASDASAACLRGAFNGNLCVPLCASGDDCRPGYDCVVVPGAGGAYCGPAWAGDAVDPVCTPGSDDDPTTRHPFERGGRVALRSFTFDVPDDATSFFVAPYHRDAQLLLERVIDPNGDAIELEEYAGYAFSSYLFQTVSPLLVPAGPQFADRLIPGTWTAEVAFDAPASEPLCHVLHIDRASHDAADELLFLDLNLYLVDVDGLSAASAADAPSYQLMLQAFEESLAPASVRVGDVRYFDVTGQVRERFRIIRDDSEPFELVRLARQPGPEVGDLMSVNVFFIRGFAGDMSGTLGISAGIPGAAGLHGGPGSGLIFSSASLARSGGRLVGQTLAHEVGHYLGLFHTTEFNFLGQDHLEDTPACPEIGRGNSNCPDFSNLMYPAAANRASTTLTAGQAQIVRANPLTRPVPRQTVEERSADREELR